MSKGVPCCAPAFGSGGAMVGGITDNINLGAGAGWFAGLAGTIGQFKSVTVSGGLTVTPGANSINIGAGTVGAAASLNFSWADHTQLFLEIKDTAYDPAESPSFIYRGSGVIGPPTKIEAIVSVENAVDPSDVRVQDVTNGATIAEVTGLVNTTFAIVDLGVIANVPAAGAIWQLQAKSAADKKTFIYALAVSF